MTSYVYPAPGEDIGPVAGRLIELAGKGNQALVKVVHEPGLAFEVPDEVAEAYQAEREAASGEPKPKKGTPAKDAAPAKDVKAGEGK